MIIQIGKINWDFKKCRKRKYESFFWLADKRDQPNLLKFMFSKKATKIDEIITVNLTFNTLCQIYGEDVVNFVAFFETMNFIRL